MNLFSCSYSENNFWPVSYFFRGSRPCGQPGQTAECKTALVLRYWLRSKRNFYKLASELPIGSFITKCTRVHTCETVNKSSKSSSYYIDSANLLSPAVPLRVGALLSCAFFWEDMTSFTRMCHGTVVHPFLFVRRQRCRPDYGRCAANSKRLSKSRREVSYVRKNETVRV